MLKEIKVILQKQVSTGGLKFTVVEMVSNPAGGFPIESPLSGASVTILQGVNQIYKGTTDGSGVYQADYLPVDSYTYRVELNGYSTQEKLVTVE